MADGWAVVPILPGKKNPNDPDWLKKPYTPSDFPVDSNVGVKCGKASNHRTDVDMDAPEAVRIGQALLYNTNCIHGRPGKPSSHWWYTCPGSTSRSFKDIDGNVLIEIRSDGGQTVVPPSVHASGDVLTWERDGAPATIAPDDLVKAVRAVAVAALFARHWPRGSRHVAAGHLAGFLLRLGFDDQWTLNIVEQAATAAKDEEVKDRVKIAKDTCRKHRQGEKTTGGPKLAEVFEHGLKLAERVYEWFDRPGDDLLDMLNEKHFVARRGADMMVAIESEYESLVFQTFDQFKQLYYNKHVGKTSMGEWWLRHHARRTYDTVVFAPPPLKCSPQAYNLWKGFTVVPDPHPNPEQRCARFLNHLHKVICDGNDTYYLFLLDVCAITCQFPGTPSGIIVVMKGDQGGGKGTFMELFGSLFGMHFVQLDQQQHVTGRFNAILAGKVVVFADEALWGGDKKGIGTMRRMATEKTLAVEYKFKDTITVPNCVHMFMATNEDFPYNAGFKERRGFILDVPKKVFATDEYFAAIRHEWNTGGAEAFLALCLQRQLKSLYLKPPTTAGLIAQQKLAMDPITAWWLTVLTEGTIGTQAVWPDFIDNTTLYDAYIDAVRKSDGPGRHGTSVQVNQKLRTLLPTNARTERRYVDVNIAKYGPPVVDRQQRRGWALPSLAVCRQRFDDLAGSDYPWPTMEDAQPPLVEVGGSGDVL